MSDPMQQFLSSLEITTGGGETPGPESVSFQDDSRLQVQDFSSLPDTTTPAPPILMDSQSLQAFGNSIRDLKKDSWGPDHMEEWDRFVSAGSLEERLAILFINILDVKELLGRAA